ncbi:MAG: hypothetical protein JO288_05025 [Hyphomicrobiales bacterium]|nr:hypothetical protein [Hyphomicrobiales bacterium]
MLPTAASVALVAVVAALPASAQQWRYDQPLNNEVDRQINEIMNGTVMSNAAPVKPLAELVERGVAGSTFETSVEPRAGFGGALRAGGEFERLEPATEPQDHAPRDFDGVALPIAGVNELADETLSVDPTERVVADVELPGVVGEDEVASEPILGGDQALQRAAELPIVVPPTSQRVNYAEYWRSRDEEARRIAEQMVHCSLSRRCAR